MRRLWNYMWVFVGALLIPLLVWAKLFVGGGLASRVLLFVIAALLAVFLPRQKFRGASVYGTAAAVFAIFTIASLVGFKTAVEQRVELNAAHQRNLRARWSELETTLRRLCEDSTPREQEEFIRMAGKPTEEVKTFRGTDLYWSSGLDSDNTGILGITARFDSKAHRLGCVEERRVRK